MNPIDAYDFAWQHARRNPDGSLVETDLVSLIAGQVDFDVEEAKLGLARRIVARRKRPGQTAAEGQIVLPGLELYPYEPFRLLVDDEGNIVENRSARPRFKEAEARRAADGVTRARDRFEREQAEADHFAAWSADEARCGRDPRELTWETCVKESGLWKEPDVEGDEEAESESAS